MQKEISEEEKHISIGKFIVVAGNVLFYRRQLPSGRPDSSQL